jgi:hypothetical protein
MAAPIANRIVLLHAWKLQQPPDETFYDINVKNHTVCCLKSVGSRLRTSVVVTSGVRMNLRLLILHIIATHREVINTGYS